MRSLFLIVLQLRKLSRFGNKMRKSGALRPEWAWEGAAFLLAQHSARIGCISVYALRG